jgi:signal transduction histidine kinase/CheY-like chemotaxis protein
MKVTIFDNWLERISPHLPVRFREGRLPYLFCLVVIMIIAMLLVAMVTPYDNGIPVPMAFGVVLMGLLVAFSYGMPMPVAVHIGVVAALTQVSYAGWVSGGIFSPRLAWYTLIPLIPFYAISRRAGLFWLTVVLALLGGMSYATWHGWLPAHPTVGLAQVRSSFASNAVTMLLILSVVFLYDGLYRKAYNERLKRRQELEDTRLELERTSELREQFIANVSHELRTPMNAILGFNAMLIGRAQNKPQALKILNHTRQSADHLMTVINDVLDYSQLQAGKIRVQFETFALHDTVNNAFSLFNPRVKSMHLQYHCEIAEGVPEWVSTDRHRLMQILVNLLGNAIKFTHQGHVTLRVECVEQDAPQGGVTGDEKVVKFSVQDSGIGIAEHQKSRIFQRFVQADDEIQSRYGGTGLGLSITRRLIDLMGGRIGFDSTWGQGSTFWFTLPLTAQATPPQPVAHNDIYKNTNPQRLNFMVVDDHPINRLLVKKVLTNHWPHSKVVEAEDGLQALAAVQKDRFDVIFMDMVMPKMDGIEATQALRLELDEATRNTPVLGLTANVNPIDLERFKQAGLNDVMLKPFDPVQLCGQIETLILNRRTA